MKNLFIIPVLIVIGFFLIFVNFENIFSSKIEIPNTASEEAKNFAKNAEKQIGIVTKYDFSNGYYGNGGLPPDDTGVCSDVIWCALARKDIEYFLEKYFEAKSHNRSYSEKFGEFERMANG